MKLTTHLLCGVAALVFTVAGVPLEAATTEYTYTGNTFTTVGGTPEFFTTSDFITATITLDGSVTDGTVTSNNWLSWSVSSAGLTVTSSSIIDGFPAQIESVASLWGSGPTQAYITLSGGAVTDWNIYTVAQSSGDLYVLLSDWDGTSAQDIAGELNWGSNPTLPYGEVATAGSWSLASEPGSVVPEPFTLGTMSCGAFLLALARRRRGSAAK
jgi:hypothetical protein